MQPAGATKTIIKRPAARESPEAMEPPAVSRFLYRLEIVANKKRNYKPPCR